MRQSLNRPSISHQILKPESKVFYTEVDLSATLKSKVSLPSIPSIKKSSKPNPIPKSSSNLNTPRYYMPTQSLSRKINSVPFNSIRPSPILDQELSQKKTTQIFTKNPETLTPILRQTIQSSIKQLQQNLMKKAKQYNKLHFEATQKSNLLKKLQTELSTYEKIDDSQQNLSELLTFRRTQLKEIYKGTSNQHYYQQTLKFMIQQRRNWEASLQIPVLNLKEDLHKLLLRLKHSEQESQNLKTDLQRLQNEISSQKKLNSKAAVTRQKQRKELNKLFYCKQHLFQLLVKQKNNAITNQKFMQRTQIIKQMEEIYNWLKEQQDSLDKYSHKHSQLLSKQTEFQQIQQVTGVTSVSDMLTYNQYLIKNHHFLTQAISEATQKLEILVSEREKRKNQLNEFIFHHQQDRSLNLKQFEEIETYLQERTSALDDNDNSLQKLVQLLSAACSSVNRLSLQLLGDTQSVDCKPRNVVKFLNICQQRLEERLEKVLVKNIHWEQESVNTSIRYQKPPKWLNLLNTKYVESNQGEFNFRNYSQQAALEYTSRQLQNLRRTRDLDEPHN